MEQRLRRLRSASRISANQIIASWCHPFFRQHGDRLVGDDPALTAGFGRLNDRIVTVLGINRGQSLEERRQFNGGALTPIGYRLAKRAVLQAEKFQRPVISLINMPGADASPESERYNQSQAIAELMMQMGELQVPNIAIFLGEGHSGGALAFANANRLIMLDDALFNVASPEAVAAILRKQYSESEILKLLPMTATELGKLGLVDQIIEHQATNLAQQLAAAVDQQLKVLETQSPAELVDQRQAKFANFSQLR